MKKELIIGILIGVVIGLIVGFLIWNSSLLKTDEEKCLKAGGKWGMWIPTPDESKICNLPTSDGGKACTDSSQCEEFCEAPEGSKEGDNVTGHCAEWTINSCWTMVREGIVGPTACV